MRYLDPKNDLTFKKVFGQHPHLLRSFLNALLPLEAGREIVSLEYLPAEMVPEIPGLKYSIVDVRCEDNRGRQFIVEMQMLWTDSFKSRVLLNASKAYVGQLSRGGSYKALQPVYALSLVNEIFEPTTAEFYHHYQFVHTTEPDKRLEGLELIFVELPKFKPATLLGKRMQVLWLRYLTEIRDQSEQVAPDLLADPVLQEAVEYLRESAFTRAELAGYDKYWDAVSSERTLLADSLREGLEQGIEQGVRQGLEQGIEQGVRQGLEQGLEQGKQAAAREIARRLMETGVSASVVAEATGLSVEEVWRAAAE